MADKIMTIHKTIVGEGSHGKELLTVKKKWSSEWHAVVVLDSLADHPLEGSKLKATFVDADDKERTVELHGDMFGTTANITLSDGTTLAHISRKLINATDIIAEKQTVSWKACGSEANRSTTLLSCPESTSRSLPLSASASTRSRMRRRSRQSEDGRVEP